MDDFELYSEEDLLPDGEGSSTLVPASPLPTKDFLIPGDDEEDSIPTEGPSESSEEIQTPENLFINDSSPRTEEDFIGMEETAYEDAVEGNDEDLEKALSPIIGNPEFSTWRTDRKFAELKKIYDSKDYWTDTAKQKFKDVSSLLWESAEPDETPSWGAILGEPPELKSTNKEQGIADYQDYALKARKELESEGINPIFYGDTIEKHLSLKFQDALAAAEYRENKNNSFKKYSERFINNSSGVKTLPGANVVDTFFNVTDTGRAIKQGAVSSLASTLSAVPRILGYEETADSIEQRMLSDSPDPSRDFDFEVDEKGNIQFDDYGRPKTKFQGKLARALGDVFMTMGPAYVVGAASGSLAALASLTPNILKTANSAYQDAKENGGSDYEGRLASLYSLPSSTMETVADLFTVAGGKTLKGLSTLNKAKVLARRMATDAVVQGSTEAIQQRAQDVGTSIAIGRDITDIEKDKEAGILGAVTAPIIGASFGSYSGNTLDTKKIERIQKELQEFQNSTDKETFIAGKVTDIDPEIAQDVMGLEVTEENSNTVKVTKPVDFVEPIVVPKTVEEADSVIDVLKKDIDSTPTEEDAFNIQEEVNTLKADYKAIPEDVKERATDLNKYEAKKKALEQEIPLLEEGSKERLQKEGDLEETIGILEDNSPEKEAFDKNKKSNELLSKLSFIEKPKTKYNRDAKQAYLYKIQQHRNALKAAEEASITEEGTPAPAVNESAIQLNAKKPFTVREGDFPLNHVNPWADPKKAHLFTEAKVFKQDKDVFPDRSKIVKALENIGTLLNPKNPFKVRFGGRSESRRALGVALPGKKYGRVQVPNDISTTVHEASHGMQYEILPNLTKLPVNLQKALIDTANRFYGKKNLSRKQKLAEGFAVFLEHKAMGLPVHRDLDSWYDKGFKQTYPKLHQGFNEVINLTHAWRDAKPELVTRESISGKEDSKLKVPDLLKLDVWFHDSGAAARIIDKLNNGNTRLKNFIDVVRYSGRHKIQQLSTGKMLDFLGREVREGALNLKQAFAPAKGNMQELADLMAAVSTLASEAKGMTEGLSINDANATIDKLKQHPNWEGLDRALNNYYQWQLDTQEIFARMSPYNRYLVKKWQKNNTDIGLPPHGFYMPNVKEGMGLNYSPLKKKTGSRRRNINPITQLEKEWGNLFSFGERRSILDYLVAIAASDKHPSGAFLAKVPRENTKVYENTVENVLTRVNEVLGDFGVNLDDIPQDDLLQSVAFFAPEVTAPRAADGYTTLMVPMPEDGKVSILELHPSVLSILKDQSKFGISDNFFWQLVTLATRLTTQTFKAGVTGLRPNFILTNLLLVDPEKAYRYIKKANPVEYATALFKGLTTEFLYAASSGKITTPLMDLLESVGAREAISVNIDRAIDAELTRKLNMPVITATAKGFYYLQNLLATPEAANRYATTMMIMKEKGITQEDLKTLNPIQAFELALAFKESTTNFQIQGELTKKGNVFIPFLTSIIAGTSQNIQDFKRNPKKAIPMAISYTIAGLLTAAMYDDDDDKWFKEISDLERTAAAYIPIDINGLKYIMNIKLPQFTSVFYNGGIALYENLSKQDPELKHSFMGYILYQLQNMTPVDSIYDLAPSPWLKEALIQGRGEGGIDEYTGKPIVSKQLRMKAAGTGGSSEEYYSYTSELSKRVGKATGISPARIDHYIGSGVGRGYLDLINYAEQAAGLKDARDTRGKGFWSNIFLKKGLASSIQDKTESTFRDLEQSFTDKKALETKAEGDIRKALNRISDDVADITTLLYFEPEAKLRDDLYKAKHDLLTKGIKIARGEKLSVPDTGLARKAKVLREQDKKERLNKLKAQTR